MSEPTKGYVIVASRRRSFYTFAINLMESIRDFYPDANICFFTEEKFLDGREKVASIVELCDDHKRAKVWGMARSPYDITFYIDADTECEHEDIKTIFDQMNDGKYDVMFTGLPKDRQYCYAEVYFPAGYFKLCGAVCLYDMRNPLVREFMHDWFDLTNRQYAGTWWPTKEDGTEDTTNYPESLKRWDQFSLWWLTNKESKYKDLRVGILEDDARWNFYTKYKYKHNIKPVVIRHYSSSGAKSLEALNELP
jgi:hypothetical protein